jgi:hypothetical protein
MLELGDGCFGACSPDAGLIAGHAEAERAEPTLEVCDGRSPRMRAEGKHV